MKASTRWIALPLLMVLAACGDAGEDSAGGLADRAMPESAIPDTPVDAAMGMDQFGGGQTVLMEPLQDSGVGGEVTITGRGDQVEIMVRLTGTPPESTHPGHVHTGRCTSIGAVVQPLESITTDAVGTGTMTTTVEIPPMTLMDGQHIVVYHGNGGAPITCAAIPMRSM